MAMYRTRQELLDTDWQAKINQAVSQGDWQAAAQYEQTRNEKIAVPEYTGRQTPTYRYTQYLPQNTPAAGMKADASPGKTAADLVPERLRRDGEGVPVLAVYDTDAKTLEELSVEEYLPAVLAGEMA